MNDSAPSDEDPTEVYLRNMERAALREKLVTVALPEVLKLSLHGSDGPIVVEQWHINDLADKSVRLADAILAKLEGDA